MDAAIERHPRTGGDPAYRDSLDSRVRGNDHLAASTLCQHSRVHNTLSHARCGSLTYSPAFTLGILESAAIAGRSQSDMASSKGRCPFPENVDGRVVIALMGHTTRTGPDTVAQGDACIAGAADMTKLTGGKPRVDMVHDGASLRSHLMVILRAELIRQIPMECLTHMGHALMHTRQMALSTRMMARATLCAGERTVGLRDGPQCLREGLGCVDRGAVRAREIGLEAEVKACTFTCHGSTWRRRPYDTGEEHVQIAQGIPLHGDCLDGALDLTGLGKLVDRGADAQTVATEQLPPGLFQRKRFRFADSTKRGWAKLVSGHMGFTILQVLKEALIALVNPFNNVLDGLRAKRRPPNVFWQFLELGNMSFQAVRRKTFAVHTMVSFVEGNAMVSLPDTLLSHVETGV